MKHLKLFENTQQYESYKNGSDYVLPHVSYVKETKEMAYEAKKEFILRAKYSATSDNLVAFTDATNIKSLKVNGTSIKIEPIKNEILTFDVLGENITMNRETGEATFPESYLIKSPVSSWSFKAKDPNYVINENTYVCMLGIMDGMPMANPLPFEEAMNFGFTTNDGVTIEATDAFFDEMNMQIQSGMQIGFTLLDMEMDSETFVFIDTEHHANITTGGLPTYSFDSEGFYDVKIELDDPNLRMVFTETPLISIEISDGIPSIGEYAFEGCKSLTSVTIGNSVTSIGEFAFYYCTSLESVTIGNSVTSIGDNAFNNCSSLPSVTIPNSVTSIGSAAFHGCSSLTSVTIPDSVTTMGYETFSDCTSLTSITIPDSVTKIGYYAFCDCSSLTSVIISNSVTSIEENTFYGCSSLTSITIPDSVTSIGQDVFYNCSSLTSVTIPNSVTTIGTRAFYGCSSLTSITIPDSVTSMGDSTFKECSKLTTIYCKATTPPLLNSYHAIPSNATTIYVPMESVNAYKSAYGWSSHKSSIVGYNF